MARVQYWPYPDGLTTFQLRGSPSEQGRQQDGVLIAKDLTTFLPLQVLRNYTDFHTKVDGIGGGQLVSCNFLLPTFQDSYSG